MTNSAHPMLPGLFRHSKAKNEALFRIENDLTHKFTQRSIPFLDKDISQDWDRLFFMQHYGIPTRLLDWSENPFVALYFSLSKQITKKTDQKDAVLWMVDPVKWNRCALTETSYAGGVLDKFSPEVESYALGAPYDQMKIFPLMLLGSHNSARIVSQRGVFCLFGKSSKPLESTFISSAFDIEILQKIVIPKENIPTLRESLFRKGLSESVIFPDLEGLSKELRRQFGF